jgi:hypothetical protein
MRTAKTLLVNHKVPRVRGPCVKMSETISRHQTMLYNFVDIYGKE